MHDSWLKRERGWPFTFQSQYQTEGGEIKDGVFEPWQSYEPRESAEERHGLLSNALALTLLVGWWAAANLTKPERPIEYAEGITACSRQ